MKSCRNWFSISLRYCAVAILCLAMALGCSGKGGPTAPDVEGGGLSDSGAEDLGLATGATQTGNLGGPQSPVSGKPYVDGEVLVVLHQPELANTSASLLQGWPLRHAKTTRCRWGTIYRLEITDGSSVEEMVNRLKAEPRVWIAEPNYIVYPTEAPYVPDDPLWEGFDTGDDPRDSAYDQWGPAKLSADLVWNEQKGSEEVIVAVTDSGVRFDHEDLNEILWINEDEIPDNGIDDDDNGWTDDWWGWDAYNSDNDPEDDNTVFHGTACAGIIGAIQDNEKGCTGIAPGVRIMVLKSLGTWAGTEEALAETIEYARVNGAHILSMSLGAYQFSEIWEQALNDAWDGGNGMVLVGGAGNSNGTDLFYPASYDSVMAIGGTVPFDNWNNPIDEQRIVSGQHGYDWGSNYGSHLSVMGFGEKYVTTHGSHYYAYRDGIEANFFSGTSCATPTVSGTLALLKSYYPDETAQWYWDRIEDTADDLDALGFDIQTANGRINALRAIYGSDRFSDLEDAFGFVELEMPAAELYDSIHHAPGNPYEDVEDLYRTPALPDGALIIELDIYTWGENLDLSIYSDQDMTQLVAESVGPNHFDSSYEEISFDFDIGGEFFIKVYSPEPGNSTTYGLKVRHVFDSLSVTGESIAPAFISQGGEIIPFLKLTLETGYQATLDEIIINKSGSLPNPNWVQARLYRDNGDGIFSEADELIAQETHPGTNRARLDGLGISWDWKAPIILFVAADISQTLEECTVALSLESYKDVSTASGLEAHYTQFPIRSDLVAIGTDDEPPEWVTTIGAQSAEPSFQSVILGWNEAIDLLTPPVMYNVYHSDILPFDIGDAIKLSDVSAIAGSSTDFEFKVTDLPAGVEQHFVVRAEDQAGNEDDNLVTVSCEPGSGGDPSNPEIMAFYPFTNPGHIALNDDVLLLTDQMQGLVIFDREDPVNLVQVGNWNGEFVIGVCCDDSYAYCGGIGNLNVIDITTPSNPQLTDSTPYSGGTCVAKIDHWVYVAGSSEQTVLPVDVANPYNIVPYPMLNLAIYGFTFDMAIRDDYIYISQWMVGGYIIDRSNPGNISHVSDFAEQNLGGIDLSGDLLYAEDWISGGLDIWDIGTNPTNPSLIGTSHDGPSAQGWDLVVVGDYVYNTRIYWGIAVFDISDPTDPQFTGDLPLEDVSWIATDGVFKYVVVMNTGLYVIL